MRKPAQNKGMLSTMPKQIYRPALMKVSHSKPNSQLEHTASMGGKQNHGTKPGK